MKKGGEGYNKLRKREAWLNVEKAVLFVVKLKAGWCNYEKS
jgi:hypothetical protein